MIVWVYTAHQAEIYFLDASFVQIALGNDGMRIYRQGDTCRLRLPKTWRAEPYDEAHKVFRLFREDGQTAVLSLCPFTEGYGRFRPYAVENVFSIGSAIDDTFYLEDSRLPPHGVRIDGARRSMTIAPTAQVSRNGRSVTGTIPFSPGDVFRTYNLQFAIHGAFVLMNQVANLYTTAPLYQAIMEQPFEPVDRICLIPSHRTVHLEKKITIELEEPLPFSTRQFNPLIFMMGPAMTMGTASLTVGLMNMQQALLQGKSVQQSMSMLILPTVMLVSTLLWAPLQRFYEKRHEARHARRRLETYRAYLSAIEQEILQKEKFYEEQCRASFLTPDVSLQKLPHFIYRHHPRQADWMFLYLGEGQVHFTVDLQCAFRLSREDPLRTDVENLRKRTETRDGCPVVFSLLENRYLYLFEPDGAHAFFDTLLLQIVIYFSPCHCRLAFLADADWLQSHVELRSLPHVWCDAFRLLISGEKEIRILEHKMRTYPQLHFIVCSRKKHVSFSADLSNYTILYFDMPQKPVLCDAEIRCSQGKGIQSDNYFEQAFTWEPLSLPFSHYIGVLRRYADQSREEIDAVSFLRLYGIHGVPKLPMQGKGEERSVWIGRTTDHEPFLLDLSEYGYGPHGLIAGMTGSGKSELLQNIVIGLMLRYTPEEVQFVLIDFKGGGLSGSILRNQTSMAHIAATLSNLSIAEMERALWSLRREIARRQKVFQECAAMHGVVISDIHACRRYRTMPDLIIIVDEFAQLKKERPEFLAELIALARVGRSLGLHLLLATQKPAGVVDEQIWSNCHFKICLKVQSAADSREVIETGDAAGIQNPGEMYVLCDGHLYHVYGVYAGGAKEQARVQVSTLALNGAITETLTDAADSETEARFLLQCIDAAYGRKTTRPLWENLPAQISFYQTGRPAYGVGKIDAIQTGTFPWFTFATANLWYVAPDHERRHRFAASLMDCLDRDCPAKAKLIGVGLKKECRRHPWAVLEAEEEERFQLLMKQMERERSDTFWIVFADAQILPDYPFLQDWFSQILLRHGEHVHCIFGTDVSSALTHRFRARFEKRIAFSSMQEAGALFERGVHRSCSGNDGLVLNREEIARCRFICDFPKSASTRPSFLPAMPETVRPEENEASILLGIHRDTLTKYAWPRHKKLALVTVYTDEKELFRPFLQQPNAVYMTVEEYRLLKEHERKQYDAVLLGGKGYKDQFLFPIDHRRPLRPKEALLIVGSRQEVIHLVES